jgi:hypothetical protein
MVSTRRRGWFLSSYLVEQFPSAASVLKDIRNHFISAGFELVSYPSIFTVLTSTGPRLVIFIIAKDTLGFAGEYWQLQSLHALLELPDHSFSVFALVLFLQV